MSANFSVRFIVNEQTQTRVIRLTDTSTGFTLSKGIFSVYFPDGSTRIKTNINNPDITSSGGYVDIPAVVDKNGILKGNYSVSFVALGTDNQEYTFSRNNFDFNWEKPVNGIKNYSDVVIPEVKFYDENSYNVIGNFSGNILRVFQSSFPSTSEASANAPISASGQLLDVVSNTNYYEGVYNPSATVSGVYTHSSNSWLSVEYYEVFTKQFIVKKCPNQSQLITKINSYRAVIDGYKEKNDERFNLLSEQYDLVIALYSHIIARFETGSTDGSESQLRELLSILEPYDTNYQYQATKMLPFELSTTSANSFTISNGVVSDTILLGQTVSFISNNPALQIGLQDNAITFSPTFGTTATSFAQGNDSRFHNAVTLGTPNGLSLSNQALSLALATVSSAGAMSSSDKSKLDGIAPNAQIGTVTSVGFSAPSAFNVTGAPITGSGTIVLSAAGTPQQYITGAGALATLNTTVVAEGTNLYYTQARFDSAFGSKSTTNLAEGTNLYFTNARARAAISASGNISYNSTTGVISYTTPAETDPIFTASPSFGITSTNISNWNTAYGWGNHASVGYLTAITSSLVTTALGFTPENSANKGVANGYASLDSSGLVPASQLPSYVDDVLEYANLASFPATGTTGKIYVDLATNKTYRWSGTVYVEISPTIGTTWGSISGTLSNQTDLQNALNAKQNTITLTTTGNSGAATFASNTLNIPTYTLAGLGGITASFLSGGAGISYNSSTGVIASTITQYTDALARAAISVTATGLSYSSSTGVVSLTSGYTIPTTTSATNWNTAYTFVNSFPSQTGNAGKYLTTNGTALSWASFAGLLPTGGTAGQILAKVDATNYNTTWIDNYAPQIKHDVKLNSAMTAGTAVYVLTSNGTNMIVEKASNASEATSSKTLGLIQTSGIANDIVKVITEGLLAGLDTSLATIGDPVWLGTNGQLLFGLANKPVAPAHMVYLGVVTRVNANNGEIFVKVQNGYELDELHNVLLSSISNNQGLFYESATGLWKNKSIATVLGYTPYDASNPAGYISSYTETDPTVGSHIKAITTTNITNWNTAYGWGNHASAGYLTSYTETDPTVGSHIKAITTTNITNWNTAYGWGNHASAGYLTGITSNQVVNALGYTPVPSTRTITINGTTYDLSADRTWSITLAAAALSSLTDVTIATPANGQLLQYSSATSKWVNWTPNYLTANQSITLSGDATGSGTTAITVTLANSGVTAGTYRSVTVDAKGRVTAGTNPTTISGYGITDLLSQVLTGYVVGTNTALAATDSILGAFQKLQGQVNARISANQTITLSGDATGSGTTAITVTLANSGVTAGTYRSVTVDAKGRVTAGTNPTTISGYGITDVLAQVITGYAVGANTAVTNTDTIETAIEKLQGQVNARISGNQTITVSGDATGSGTTAITLTLVNSGVTAGSYGSASAIPVITVDAKGRVTSISTSAVSIVSTLAGLSDVTITTPSGGQLLQYDGTSSKWINWTPNYLTANQSISISGDATGSGTTSISLTLANSGVTAGSYGSASAIPVITVDAKGRVTSVSTQAVSIVSTLAGLSDVTITTPANGQLLQYNSTSSKWVNWTPNYITGNQSITVSGDATGSGTTAISLTLANSGVTAGTYRSVTVDAKGRVTAGTNPTTVSGYGITDILAQVITGYAVGTNTAVANTDTIETAIEKLQGQVNARISGNQTITLSGDATGSGTTAITVTLANSGVTAGTYTKVTVDAKGRVTSGASLASADLPTYTGTLTSSQVTTALGYTPYNSTNPNGYTSNTGTVTSVSGTGSVSGLTLSGTVTTSGSITLGGTLSASIDNIVDEHRVFNNMGDNHSTRTSFDATSPSYNFGWRYVQGNTNSPNVNAATQYYSLYIGLGNDYLATGAGSYGMMLAIPRNVTTPYLAIRYNENNTFAAWQKISAGYADSAGSVAWTNVSGRPTALSSFTNDSGYITSSSVGNGTLTLAVSGTGLSGSATFSANQSSAATFTVTSNATSANTASTIVARDASGNFTAGTITAALSGNATTATTLQTARTINGVSFNGSANITVTANTTNALTLAVSGTGLSGSASFNGSAATTFTVTSNATSANTASTIVARDASGNFTAGTITAALSGNATTATTLQTARTINGVSFNGSANITVTANTTNALTLAVSGTGLSGSASFNGSAATTFTVTSNATSANTASTIVARDASGNFSAGSVTVTLLTETSSIRYKENILTLEDSLEKVVRMRGVSYNRKGTDAIEIGVIAEEINEILPNVIVKDENGKIDSVQYSRLTAVLIEAIKEQQKQIDELKSRI